MKRRLRKKRVGEFRELGFEVRGDLRPGLARAELDAFMDRLIDYALGACLAKLAK